ncbi:vesicle-associated protein 1-2-like [Salvia splendens]|uniref:vesicle-associated protein 1-2-like n=1 Tax=Salvia splendens TaxID=180675 RepID=UPI001C25DDBA|nr:vesicle-associated protein 1-2-like [Salvia splendens]XP_042044000.1 vesicle-associated protein 1-2-like [Salvia splendens]
MSSEALLNYDPPELSFQFDQNRQLSSSVRLLNETDDYVAFKLKSTNPRYYVVRPRIGILLPQSTCEIKVTMRTLRESQHSLRSKDKFMIESAAAAPDTTVEDARKLFDKESGHPIQEFILRVNYSRPTESSPDTSVIENTDVSAPEVNRSLTEPHENGLQVASSVTDSHDNNLRVINNVNELRTNGTQENDITRSGDSILRRFISNCTGESILREVIGSLLILVFLYLMKQTISWIWSLVMFVVIMIIKMIKKLVSDSVEDWIVKTLIHIVMYILFGRKENTGLT